MRTNIIKLLFLWIILIAFPSYGSAYVVYIADQEALAALSNPAEHSAEELQQATEYVMQKVASQYGYSQDELDQLKVLVYNDASDNTAGFREKSEKAVEGDIGINASKTGVGTNAYYNVLGHEYGHMQQAKNDEDGTVELKDDTDSEAYSSTVGNSFLGSINDGLYIAGKDDVNTRGFSLGLENSEDYLFTYGNNNTAASITNRDNFLVPLVAVGYLAYQVYDDYKTSKEQAAYRASLPIGQGDGLGLEPSYLLENTVLAYSLFSNGVSKLPSLINKGSGATRKVVIGENMEERVIPAAEEMGAKYYKPRSKNSNNWMENNKSWVKREVKNGSEFYDKGVDPNRVNRSKYYEMEKQTLKEMDVKVKSIK